MKWRKANYGVFVKWSHFYPMSRRKRVYWFLRKNLEHLARYRFQYWEAEDAKKEFMYCQRTYRFQKPKNKGVTIVRYPIL